jgi:hypothetical protein
MVISATMNYEFHRCRAADGVHERTGGSDALKAGSWQITARIVEEGFGQRAAAGSSAKHGLCIVGGQVRLSA